MGLILDHCKVQIKELNNYSDAELGIQIQDFVDVIKLY